MSKRPKMHIKVKMSKKVIKYLDLGGSHGLAVLGRDSCLMVMGSNPSTVCWMDIFHIYLL